MQTAHDGIHKFPIIFQPVVHTAIGAFGHNTARFQRGITAHTPLLHMRELFTGGQKHIPHHVLVIRMHAQGDDTVIFQLAHGLHEHMLQHGAVFCGKSEVDALFHGHAA